MDYLFSIKLCLCDFIESVKNENYINNIGIDINYNDNIVLYIVYRGLEHHQHMRVDINYNKEENMIYLTQNSGLEENEKEESEMIMAKQIDLTLILKDTLLEQHKNIIKNNGDTTYSCFNKIKIVDEEYKKSIEREPDILF